MNIFYIHGLNSKFRPKSQKVKVLSRIYEHGVVQGLDINFLEAPSHNISKVIRFIDKQKIDVIVGCGMGAWLAAHIGVAKSLPVVLLNPVMAPHITLANHGFTKDLLLQYKDFKVVDVASKKSALGLVIIDVNNHMIDPFKTQDALSDFYICVFSVGQGNRLEDLSIHLSEVQNFLRIAEMSCFLEPSSQSIPEKSPLSIS